MKRLTRKYPGKKPKWIDQNIKYEFNTNEDYPSVIPIFNKLGQLEDIEEQLGIDLNTLFKALDDGIYLNDGTFKDVYLYSGEYGWCLVYQTSRIPTLEYVLLSEYKKTWALTMEDFKN